MHQKVESGKNKSRLGNCETMNRYLTYHLANCIHIFKISNKSVHKKEKQIRKDTWKQSFIILVFNEIQTDLNKMISMVKLDFILANHVFIVVFFLQWFTFHDVICSNFSPKNSRHSVIYKIALKFQWNILISCNIKTIGPYNILPFLLLFQPTCCPYEICAKSS